MIKEKSILTIKDVAEYLNIHPMTVYKFAQKGKLPAFKIGSDWRFHRKYIDQWIEKETKKNGRKRNKIRR